MADYGPTRVDCAKRPDGPWLADASQMLPAGAMAMEAGAMAAVSAVSFAHRAWRSGAATGVHRPGWDEAMLRAAARRRVWTLR